MAAHRRGAVGRAYQRAGAQLKEAERLRKDALSHVLKVTGVPSTVELGEVGRSEASCLLLRPRQST